MRSRISLPLASPSPGRQASHRKQAAAAVALIDEPLDREPQAHFYADRAPAWYPIHDDLPRFGGPEGSTRL